jgi:hypothetical protein
MCGVFFGKDNELSGHAEIQIDFEKNNRGSRIYPTVRTEVSYLDKKKLVKSPKPRNICFRRKLIYTFF